MKQRKQPDYLLVPIPMCIWVAQNNKEDEFQLFLFLKLLYSEGKTKLTPIELQALVQMMDFADNRPLKRLIKNLKQLEWIKYNAKTRYYLLASFDKLRQVYGWESRASLECAINEVSNIKAFVGAAIFVYQHKDFWRKVKREKSVRIKGRTYHFLTPSFNYKEKHAPVATTGVNALYNISTSKASSLKREAEKMGYINVVKDYKELPYSKAELNLLIKYGEFPENLVKYNDVFYLQLIDLILPLIPIRRRHKLVT